MRVVISDFVSLDGVGRAPGGPGEDTEGGFTNGGWSMPFDWETMGSAINEAMATTSALLFGRRTWQVMAAAWPGRAGDPFADRMNEIDKYVVSRILTQADLWWGNSTLLPGDDLVGAVQRLRSQDGGDVQVLGSLSLARTLISNDLVDEYRLMIEPVILGGGKRLFPDDGRGAYSRTRRHHGQQDGRAHLHLPSRPRDRELTARAARAEEQRVPGLTTRGSVRALTSRTCRGSDCSASRDQVAPGWSVGASGAAAVGALTRSSITCQTSLSSWFSFQMP